ncbi:UTRA domain-containing protein [Pelistega sp. NLN82]|uniref:UTRA domain-containing protein n=1 Tax=Pelistega ratti TaxID=2652177 RepID=A0A6L9Y878_9BURK|nr:UTRA domain-containing protein [Pelistega ratti]NEN75974.1 UTRA domain-containing protein [Pelistega ratti]
MKHFNQHAIPLYKQIQEYIMQQITSNAWKAGEKIPTEIDIAVQFKVSRMTVNKAISLLSEQGILFRVAGKGTFVKHHQAEMPLTTIVDLSQEIQQRGSTYSSKVLAQKQLIPAEDIAWHLGVKTGTKVSYVEILHLENNFPTMLERRYVNPLHAPDFITQDFQKITPTAYLLKHFPLSEIEQYIEAINALPEWESILNIPPQTACLQMFRRTWSNNILISYTCLVAVGSRYKLHSRYTPYE